MTLKNIALLKVTDVNRNGAYLYWGLDKDLFVPYSEQTKDMVAGQTRLVYLYLDEMTDRLVATEKIDRYLTNDPITGRRRKKWISGFWNQTDLGYNVVLDEKRKGLIYHNEFYRDVHYGDQTTGYIKQIRDDDKTDVTLRPIGYNKVEPNARHILQRIRAAGSLRWDLHDRSDPDRYASDLKMGRKNLQKSDRAPL
ncbi:MAG: S1-like domain-containing RNA-binding protein [Balneolaceae bacterium]|nr:S1-like domain-containing RNA-binding protein [Balneolaceae bacterium]